MGCITYANDSYNELYHHGVKGMKWGVRRLEKYKTRETAKVLKRKRKKADIYKNYIERKSNKYDQIKSIYGDKHDKTRKIKYQINKSKDRARRSKLIAEAEIKKISKMTVKDMNKEMLAVGGTIAASLLVPIRGTTVGAIVSSPYIKTAMRVDKETRNKIQKSSR